MNIVHKLFFSSILTLSITSAANLGAMDSSSSSELSLCGLSDTKKLIDKKEFESVTPTAMFHFGAIKDIDNILLDLIKKEFPSTHVNHIYTEGIQPNQCQTIQGLFLEVSEQAIFLHTPWGKRQLISKFGGHLDLILKTFLASLDTELYMKHDGKNYFGIKIFSAYSLYKIKTVKGKKLPEAVQRPCDFSFSEYKTWIEDETVQKVWNKLKIAYKENPKLFELSE